LLVEPEDLKKLADENMEPHTTKWFADHPECKVPANTRIQDYMLDALLLKLKLKDPRLAESIQLWQYSPVNWQRDRYHWEYYWRSYYPPK
jgi:hypothetical protein